MDGEDGRRDELAHMLERIGEVLTTLGDRVVLLEQRSTALEGLLQKAHAVVELHDASIRKLGEVIAGATRPPARRQDGLN